MKPDRRASLALVRHALGRARFAQVGLGVFVAGLGWLFTLALDEKSGIGARILVWGMTGFFALIAAVLFWVGFFKSSPSRSPLVHTLMNQPDDVVWLYQQDAALQMNGTEVPVADTNIVARLANGSTVAITVNKKKAATLMNALQSLAPRAAIGFSEEREALFKLDPRALSGPL